MTLDNRDEVDLKGERSMEDLKNAGVEPIPDNMKKNFLPRPQGIHLITAGPWAGKYLITVPAEGGKVIPIGQSESIDKAAEVHDLVAIGLYGKQADLNFPAEKYKMERFIEILLSLQKLFPSNKFWAAFKNALEAGLKLHPGNSSGFPDMNGGHGDGSQRQGWPQSKPQSGSQMWASVFANFNRRNGIDPKKSGLHVSGWDAGPRDAKGGCKGEKHGDGNESNRKSHRGGKKASSEPAGARSAAKGVSGHSAPAGDRSRRDSLDFVDPMWPPREEVESERAEQAPETDSPLEDADATDGLGKDNIENVQQAQNQPWPVKDSQAPEACDKEGMDFEREESSNGQGEPSHDLETETDDEPPQAAEKSQDSPTSHSTIRDLCAETKPLGHRTMLPHYKGVGGLNGGLLFAAVDWEGHPLQIGQFNSPTKAARAYDRVSLGLFGGDADTNFPPTNYTQHEVQQAVMELKNRTGQIHRRDVANAGRNAESAGVPTSPVFDDIPHHRQASTSQLTDPTKIAMANKTRTGRAIKRPVRYRDSPIHMSDMEDSPTATRDSDQPKPRKSHKRAIPPSLKTVMSAPHSGMSNMNRPMPMMPMGPGMVFPPMFPMMPMMGGMGGMPMPFGFPGMRPPMGPPGMPFPPPFLPGFKHPNQNPKRQ
ncbi:hypothetical protein BSKO_00234 [Bryopsis sp. KO-2023]|nr:hypothetical protein BSKO_00234 [Bryopsis sp. KO-2023]